MKLNININFRIISIIGAILFLFASDIVEAQYSGAAVAHSHRTTRRRTAVVVSSATHAKDEQAAAEQQAAADQAAADQAAAQQQAAAQPTTSTGSHLPIGTIVTRLPEGSESVVVGDVQYYHSGNDYYRVAYQENNIVYVTTDPPL